MKIGVFGGTFDPPHRGHLEFARAAQNHLGLDEVLFLPANRNPIKRGKASPARDRLAMVQLMIEDQPRMAVSDLEITRGGASYMVESLQELQFSRPGDYWLLLGADAVRRIAEWKSPEKIVKLARLAVALRDRMSAEGVERATRPFQARVDLIPMIPVDISSTELRDQIAAGKPQAERLIVPRVLDYIRQHRLYRS